MAIDLGSVELYMGPQEIGAPDDLRATIIEFMDRARKTLDVAVQEIDNESIARAIVAASQRGVKVRVVLESDYLRQGSALANPFEPGGNLEPNRALHSALLRAGIPVVSDLNPAIFHQKFIVRDAEAGRTAVLTGSTNFTDTGISRNANHLVIFQSRRIADVFQREFEELWGGTFGTSRLRHDPAPSESKLARVRIKSLFAPDHAPEMEVMKQMLKARERVDFAVFTFSQSSGIDDTMVALRRAGIRVRGVLDGGQGRFAWSATRRLVDAGAEIHLSNRDAGLGKLHHKLMVIDGSVVIAGSFNYTGPATRLNDENIVVIGNVHATDPREIANQQAFARYALTEIDRLIGAQSDPASP